ncbi:MAG TPA: hypothetical protein PLD95_04065 [bacterium]|jgi:hypothetical protein|nr:hypothetical protein [bacterium]
MANAKYVSIWDNGTVIETDCDYNPETTFIDNIEEVESIYLPNNSVLIEEYIEFKDEKYPICFECQCHTLKNDLCCNCN